MPDPSATFLSRQMARGNLSSSYLFTGNDREKKLELAAAFAKALNCDEKAGFQNCSCTSCAKVAAGTHPDVRWFGMEEEASSIKIEEMRELQSWLHLKPFEGRVKVFVINDAGKLTIDAQNALLKSLEEPPPSSILILISQDRAELLDTIVSRCLEIKVPPRSEKELVSLLKSQGADETEALFLARFSAGDIGQAKQGLEQKLFCAKNEWLDKIMADSAAGFDQIARRSRPEVVLFLKILMQWARDLCVFAAINEESLLVHADRLDQIKKIVQNCSIEELAPFFRQVCEIDRAIEDNANQKLALARLEVLWSALFKT